jgi:hypothetical protein
VRTERRAVTAGDDVAIGVLHRVEQLGDRDAAPDRVGVEEGEGGVGRHRSPR